MRYTIGQYSPNIPHRLSKTPSTPFSLLGARMEVEADRGRWLTIPFERLLLYDRIRQPSRTLFFLTSSTSRGWCACDMEVLR